MTTEPAAAGLSLVHEHGRSLQVRYRDRPLVRYVYQPWDRQLESPRPYFHPLHTLGGDEVSLYRPHDHVWHKGIAWSLPNIGSESAGQQNFWGGPTFLRGRGYEQLANDGAMRHREFLALAAEPDLVTMAHSLDWVTEAGAHWFDETREVRISVDADAWVLEFGSQFTNVSGEPLVIGSPTTQGRDNAGYGGLFWRGPRSFTGGTVLAPDRTGGDELMGHVAPWLGFTGRHDDHGRESTLIFVDSPSNVRHPTKWFVRSSMYACLCPAPFFDTELAVEPGATVSLRYAVAVADGGADSQRGAELAKLGNRVLNDDR